MSNILSPLGNIKFLAVAKPVKKFGSEDLIYTIRLEFDKSEIDFLNAIKNINEAKIVTKNVSQEGNYIVTFNSKYQPKVLDEGGLEMHGSEIPFFNSLNDNGQARVEIKPVLASSGKLGTVYLQKVQLLNLELAPRDENSSLGALESAIKAEHNG